VVISQWRTCAGLQQSRRLLNVEGSAANLTEINLLDCLPGGDAVAEVFEAINTANDVSDTRPELPAEFWCVLSTVHAQQLAAPLQAFEGVNSKVSESIEEFLGAIDGPYAQALAKSNQIAEQLADVVSVAKGLVNNEVFQAVLSGLRAFNRAITTRVKFTINLGRFCLWVSGARNCCQHLQLVLQECLQLACLEYASGVCLDIK
jgi:hypothetical protein